jgi:hypothetical protein
MKAIQLFMFGLLGIFVASACQRMDPPPPAYPYGTVRIEVVDAEGRSIVSAIPRWGDRFGDNKESYILPTYYKMEAFVDGNVEKYSSFYFADDEKLALSTPIREPKDVTIQYEITSYAIFKDDARHTFTVRCEAKENYSAPICKEVRFDGFLMPITTDEDGYSTVRIVLAGVHIHPE